MAGRKGELIMICKLCNSKNVNIIYNGKIRDGHVGNYTTSDVQSLNVAIAIQFGMRM